MNKVFKVIWSEARNAYVVVSEMAKSHGTKSCSTKKLLAMLIATGIMTCASAAPVMAEDAVNLAPDATKIAIGEGAVASGKGSVVAIGQKASASGEGSVAIGEEAVASGLVGIAIGRDAVASGADSIAIGSDTKATQTFSVAVGNDIGFTAYAGTAVGQQAYASGKEATAIGTMTNVNDDDKWTEANPGQRRNAGEQSTAIGAYACSWGLHSTAVGGFSKAEGEMATAIGHSSQANVNYGTALGAYSEVTAGWGVAIGASSVADRKSRVVGLYAPDEDKNSLTWKANAGAVSVGSSVEGEEITRQITNVAAGSADTDAVNVAQLNAVKAAAGKKVSLVDGENTKATLVKDDATGTQYKVDVDLSKYAKTEDVAVVYDKNKTSLRSTNATLQTSSGKEEAVDSIALGNGASAVKGSVAIGNGASVVEGSNGLGGVALGYKAHAGYKGTSLGSNAISGREGTTLVGANTNSGSLYTTVVGTDSVNKDGKITGVAAGEADTDAVNVSQLKKVSDTANAGWNLYTNGVATEATNVKPGAYVGFSGDDNIKVSNDGTNVKVELKDELKDIKSIIGAGEGAGSISFADGGIKLNNKVTINKDGKITGVAAGEADTDAVNVSQLKKVSDTANAGWNLYTNGVATEATNVKPGAYVGFSGDDNIKVSNDGTNVKVELKDELKDIKSIIGAGEGAGSISFADGGIKLNNKVTINKDGKITGVAAGEADTDAVNVSQLKKVSDTANAGWNLYTNGVATEATNVKPGAYVGFSGDDNIKVSNDGTNVKVELKDELKDIKSITGAGTGAGSISFEGSNVKVNQNTFNSDGRIQGVAAGVANTDAVNVGQLKEAVEAGNTDTHIKPGEYGVGADNKVNMDVVDKNGNKVDTVTIKDVAKASDVGNIINIASDIKNQDGSHTTVVDAVNNLNQKLDNKVGDLNYVEGGKGNYVTNGENTTTSIGKLDQALKDVADTANQGWNLSTNGGEASKVAPGKTVDFSGDKNIKISNDGTNVKVELNEAITAKTVTTGNTVMNSDGVKVGADVSLNKNGLNVGKDVSVTATAVTAGKTSISDEGVKVGDKTYINDKGLNANGQNITNVADGKVEKDSKDAINGGQLHQAKADINNRIDGVENQVVNNTNRINKLGSRVNKVGAAALAALHPMDFDPDDKLTFSAGYGNYGGENAAAIGAYYRPDEKVMFSVAGTVGNGENMVNAGVSFALDRTNHVSNSRTALAREVIDLRGQLAVMGAKMAKMEKAFGMLDETKTKLFPDVPANHWAYEYIAKLAGNGYIEGYPDGNFGGDRLMTRYEFAAMLYRAIEKGAALEEKIIKEFEPELGRIRVDRISGEDGDRDKIERVRVNDTKGERDHYGNKLAK